MRPCKILQGGRDALVENFYAEIVMSTISVGLDTRARWIKLAIETGAGAAEVQKQCDEMAVELGGVQGAVLRMRPDSAALYLVVLLLASLDVPH